MKIFNLFIFSLLFVGWEVKAANYQGIVTNVAASGDRIYIILANGSFDGPSGSCASGTAMQFSIDPATPYGRALVSIVLTAKTTGRLIYIAGDGVCSLGVRGPAEGIFHLDFKG